MVTTEEMIELYARYEQTFGEAAPTMQLPADDNEAADLLRRAIKMRDASIIDRQIPPDAEA